MSTLIFAAEVTHEDKRYRALFPDIPDLLVEAGDLPALMTNARSLLAARLQALADQGEAWPTATPTEALRATPGATLILVDISVDDPPMRVNISIGERLLQRLDAAAEMRSMTRSGFITHAVRVSLGERPGAANDFEDVGRKLQDELSSLGQRITDSIGPESPFNRRMIELDGMLYDGVKRAADNVSAAMARRREKIKPNGAASAGTGPESSGQDR